MSALKICVSLLAFAGIFLRTSSAVDCGKTVITHNGDRTESASDSCGGRGNICVALIGDLPSRYKEIRDCLESPLIKKLLKKRNFAKNTIEKCRECTGTGTEVTLLYEDKGKNPVTKYRKMMLLCCKNRQCQDERIKEAKGKLDRLQVEES